MQHWQACMLKLCWIAAGSALLSTVVPGHAQRRNPREPSPAEDGAWAGRDARGSRSFLRRSWRWLAATDVLDEHLLVPGRCRCTRFCWRRRAYQPCLLANTRARADLLWSVSSHAAKRSFSYFFLSVNLASSEKSAQRLHVRQFH